MAVPNRGKRSRLLTAAVVCCFIIFFLYNYHVNPKDLDEYDNEQPAEYDYAQSTGLLDLPNPDANGAPIEQFPTEPLPTEQFPPEQAPAEQLPTEQSFVLVPNAHRLPTADSFRPHLAAVSAMQGMTMAEAKSGCSWSPEQLVNFQYGADQEWVVNERSDLETESRRQEWHNFINTGMIPWDNVKDRFSGRGIVVLAGNADTLTRLKVTLRALLKIGSSIPVEVHYWDDELSEESRQDLQSMYSSMSFNDLSKEHNIVHIKKDGVFGINYQLKTASLLNSRFAEPLLLDSDNIPIVPPEHLYDSLTYQEYHSVFWPDIARTRPQNPMWAITNTACRMDEYEQESGQLLVDKSRFWYHLQLASWLNNEQGAYYNDFLLGDKDMFRFAWHALKTEYGKPKKWLASVGTENDGFYCGNSFAQHYPDDGRVAFVHGGLLKTVPPELIKWNLERGGMFRSYKRSPTDEQPQISVNVAIKFDGADYYSPHSPDFHAAQCTDMFDVPAGDINNLIPNFEKFFEEVGGYWQVAGTA